MAAIQKAIDAGDSSGTRVTGTEFGITGQSAVVFFPTGTYSNKSTLSNRVSTMLVGDPMSRPSIKVSAPSPAPIFSLDMILGTPDSLLSITGSRILFSIQ
jgi:hypothetical protein